MTTAPVTPDGALEPAEAATQPADGGSELGHLSAQVAARRAVRYFGWCFFILAAAMLIGLLPAMLVFLLGYLRMEAREGWKMTLAVGLGAWVTAYLLFHQLLRVPWPTAVLGDLLPGLRSVGLTNLL